MELDKIKSIVAEYNKIYSLAKSVTLKLFKLDPAVYIEYYGIDSIDIGSDEVIVNTDWGDGDRFTFTFPIEFLSLSENDLKIAVTKNKEEREEAIRKRAEEEELKYKQNKEERDRKEYERLKKKFES
jgi:cytidylate kinase